MAEAVVLYVDASAPAGGDGTVARPFQSLTEAVEAAGAGATIEVAAGRYDETVEILRSVTIIGAGVLSDIRGEGTRPALIVESDGLVRLLDLRIDGVRIVGGDLFLGSVRLTGEEDLALSAENASIVVEGGTIEGGVAGGVRMTGGQLELRQLEMSTAGASAVAAVETGPLLISETRIEAVGGPAIRLERCDGQLSQVRIEDVTRSDGAQSADGAGDGTAIEVLGGRLEIDRGEFVRIDGEGIVFRGAFGEISESEFAGIGSAAIAILADEVDVQSQVEVTLSTFEEGFGVGLVVDGSDLTASENVFRRWQDLAIDVVGGATAAIEDNTLLDMGGDGIRVTGAGVGSLRRNRIVTAAGIGIAVVDQDEALTIEENSLRSCAVAGLSVERSVQVELAGNAVQGTRAVGGQDEPSAGIVVARGSDVIVEGNDSSSNAGHGLMVVDGVHAVVTANRFAENGGYGIRVWCPDEGVVESVLEVSGNDLIDNGLGGESGCP